MNHADPELGDEEADDDTDSVVVTYENSEPAVPEEVVMEADAPDDAIPDAEQEAPDVDDAYTDTDEDDESSVPDLDPLSPVRYVRLGDLRTEYKLWTNPRSVTGLDDQSIGELAASIKHYTRSEVDSGVTYVGIQDPLKVVMIRRNGTVDHLVVDGQRRLRATQIAVPIDDALVPVIDREPAPVEWTQELADKYLLEALETVGTRAGLSSFELSESADRLRKSKDPTTGKEYTLATISRAVGRSESWVSKILTARGAASPKLMLTWQSGEITDEQFKDLAVAKPAAQAKAAEAVVDARKQGNKVTGRTLAKETKAAAKATKAAKAVPEPKAGKPTKASKTSSKDGGQEEMPATAPRKPPPFAVIEDLLGLADKRPPTHDYVKGLMDGARWASGLMDAGLFGKPWQAYMHHVQGTPAGKAGKASKKRR